MVALARIMAEEPTKDKSLWKPKSYEQQALERWAGRQLRLGKAVVEILDQNFKALGFEWMAEDNFFGIALDSAHLTGRASNGDGTTSEIHIVGDMDLLMEILGKKSAGRMPASNQNNTQINWFDLFWESLPQTHHLKLLLEEDLMTELYQSVLTKLETVRAEMEAHTDRLEKRIEETNTILGQHQSALHRIATVSSTMLTVVKVVGGVIGGFGAVLVLMGWDRIANALRALIA